MSSAIPNSYLFFLSIWEACKAIELPIISIRKRSFDIETAISGGDYDFLMPADSYPKLLHILHIQAYKFNCSFTINRSNINKMQIIFHITELKKNILVEIWSELEVKDPQKRFSRFMPWANIQGSLIKVNGEFKFTAEFEAAYYLSHLYTRKKDLNSPEVISRLAYYSETLNQTPTLKNLFENINSIGIKDTSIKANQLLFENGWLKKINFYGRAFRSFLYAIEKSDIRKNRNRIQNASLITFTGTDGVGKTTIMNLWSNKFKGFSLIRFKNLFRHHLFYKPIAIYFKSKDLADKNIEKNIFDEKHSTVFFDLAKNSWSLISFLTIFGKRFLIDRSFSDMLFANLRNQTGEPALVNNWKLLAKKVPVIDWHIHLDATNEVIYSRKKEISEKALNYYRQSMCSIVAYSSAISYSRIDTSKDIDSVMVCLEMASQSLNVKLIDKG